MSIAAGDPRYKNKAAEQGEVVIEAWALAGHSTIKSSMPPGQPEPMRYPKADDAAVSQEINPNELLWRFKTKQPTLILSSRSIHVSEEGRALVFSVVNDMPVSAEIVWAGVAKTNFRPADRTSYLLAMGVEGVYTVPNTGHESFKLFDWIVGDKPRPDAKLKPVRVSRVQRGRIYPEIYPLNQVQTRYAEIQESIGHYQEEVINAIRAKVTPTVSAEMILRSTVNRKASKTPGLWRSVRFLADAKAKPSSSKVGHDLVAEYAKDLYTHYLHCKEPRMAKDFFRMAILLFMYITDWLIQNPNLVDKELSFTLLHGLLLTRYTSYIVLYCKEVFDEFGEKVIGFCLKPGKSGDRIDGFFGRGT